jgi:GTP-binding protein
MLTWKGREFRLFDTAGMRRKARIEEKLEKLSVADTLNAIRFAEVVIVLMDSEQPVRGAGPAHRRSGAARGPGARARHEQVGPDGGKAGRAGKLRAEATTGCRR